MLEGRMVLGRRPRWGRHRYEATQGDDQPEGIFLKCIRCGKVDEAKDYRPSRRVAPGSVGDIAVRRRSKRPPHGGVRP